MRLTSTIAAVAFGLFATGGSAEELSLADFQPPQHFVLGAVYEPFNDAISEATGGEVTLRAYMGGELGPGPKEQYSRVVDGVADLAFGLPGYTASTFPTTLLAELPGVIAADTGTKTIVENMDLLSEEYRRVVLVGLWNNAPNLLLMGNKPITSIDDLKGLNIRVPSRNAGLVVQAWGANPVSMPAPEIYNAMQTGVIDGAMTDATTLGAFRLAEVTKHVTQGMDTTISLFFMIMNRDAFAELSDDQQQAVLAAGRQASLNGNTAWMGIAEKALTSFAASEGKQVITLSPEEAERFDAASAAVVEQIVAEAEAEGIAAQAFINALMGE
ncbi:TRAP transporter substrate-binding protein [Ruegeria sp. SCPT10]|uniref:TRAP transporter substrate-binding protein n=1 Tax=Ruegeria sp. SCP10 TaxID=3141377 RepID=UPI00333A80F2